MESDTDTDM